MAVRHTRQYQQDRNPSDFDNDFGGRNIGDPYDGTSTYIPFDDMRGGGTYIPPVPPNNTFIPPSNTQDLINGSIIINLIAKSVNSLDFVDVEFLENDISKGIGSTSRVVYSPAISFGSKRIYKAVSAGKIANNYYEVEVVKTFTNPTDQLDPTRRLMTDDQLGTYDFNLDYNRGASNTPFTRLEELYTENIQVTEYVIQSNGEYVADTTSNYKSTGDVFNLTFYFKEVNSVVDPTPRVIEDTTISTLTEYEIVFASNFNSEISNLIYLQYYIENATGDVVDSGKINLIDGSALKNINYSEFKNGKVRLGIIGELPKDLKVNSVYKNKLVGLDRNEISDFSDWTVVPEQFEIPISELRYGVAVLLELYKEVALDAPTLSIPQTKFDVYVKESDLEKGVRIPFVTERADSVIAYINPNKSISVNSADGEISLFFQKDFDEIYGSKRVLITAQSARYGNSAPVDIIVNFVAVNDFPSITNVTYPEYIDIPSFSDLNIDVNISYDTFAATSVDVDLRKKDGTLINIFKNLSGNSNFKINVKKLNETIPEWNSGDGNLKIVLKPYNRGGAENLIGNEYEIVAKLNFPTIQLDETTIESALMQAFLSKTEDLEPERDNKYLSHLLNFGDNEQLLISSWEEDNWTLSEKVENSDGVLAVAPDKEVKSLILKLYSPLPAIISENSTSWITKLLSNPLIETIVLTEESKVACPPIKGPNFNIEINLVQGQSTSYESLDDILLSGSSQSNNLIQTYSSASIIDWKKLNIDYASGSNYLTGYLWENFVHFSSAKERLDNFVYKVQLIEQYEKLITSASTDYTGNGSAYTGSSAGVFEIKRQTEKKMSLVQGFDGFEDFLFTSSSMSWPYNGAVRYSSTATQVVQWYATASIAAQDYDNNNPNYVLNNIPQYILQYDENEQYMLFLSMIGHHFDNIYFYAKSLEDGRQMGYSSKRSVNDKILSDILKSYSWDAKNLNSNSQLWEYVFGLDQSGDTKFLSPSETRNNEIWRRILNNLPYLLKHRGTRRGIYALLSCYGIPSSNLSILEFGGPEVDNSKKGKLTMDELTYVLYMTSSATITLPWPNTENSRTPDSLEIFFRPLNSSSLSTVLSNSWNLQVSASNNLDKSLGKVIWNYGGGTLTSNEFPLFGENYTGVHLSKKNSNVYLDVAQYVGDRCIFSQSLSTAGSWAGSTGNVTIGGSSFYGYIDEVRTWSQPLSSSIFFEHTAWPEMINGNDYSSSTNDLFFRLDFEYPKNLNTYTKLLNVSPNTYYLDGYTRNDAEVSGTPSSLMGTLNGSSPLTADVGSFVDDDTYPYQFRPYERSVSAPVPSIGSSRLVGNKVRIESQTLVSNLSPTYRSTEKSFDNTPTDSNRVGLFFSPIKELNFDIIKSIGGLNLDNYIGDPSDTYSYKYSELDELRSYYFERYRGRTIDFQEYIRLIKLYEKSMFEDIKQMLPARVNATTGLLFEPHILERSKYEHKKPTGAHSDYEDTIDLTNSPVLISENTQYSAELDTADSYDLAGENLQYQTVIDSNYGESLVAESIQLNSNIETDGLFNVSSLSETGYLESANAEVATTLDEGTLQKEREAFPNAGTVGQDTISELGFGIYSEGGHAVRTYFTSNGKIEQERILDSIIKEKKEREYTYYTQGDDPRSGQLTGIETYYESKVNIQPFYVPGTTTPSTFPTTNDRIVGVTIPNGYLPTHYRFTCDLTTGLENSYWRGCKNTSDTTLDGTPPVEVFATNPNTLKVNKAGRDASEPILEVE